VIGKGLLAAIGERINTNFSNTNTYSYFFSNGNFNTIIYPHSQYKHHSYLCSGTNCNTNANLPDDGCHRE